MKWAACGANELEKERFQRLQAKLGAGHELTFIDWAPDSDPTAVDPSIQHVRWGEHIQVAVCKRLTAKSAWTALLGLADGMILRNGKWWPLCASYEALSKTCAELGSNLDSASSAFISGAGPMARAAIASLFKFGFRKFRISAVKPEDCDTLINEMRGRFFGADIERVPMNKIVLLAGVSSVFVNTVSQEEAPDLSQEVSYLNFLKRPGAIIDTGYTKIDSQLLKEAVDSAIPAVDSWHMAAAVDAFWVKWAFGADLDLESYAVSLRDVPPVETKS